MRDSDLFIRQESGRYVISGTGSLGAGKYFSDFPELVNGIADLSSAREEIYHLAEHSGLNDRETEALVSVIELRNKLVRAREALS